MGHTSLKNHKKDVSIRWAWGIGPPLFTEIKLPMKCAGVQCHSEELDFLFQFLHARGLLNSMSQYARLWAFPNTT